MVKQIFLLHCDVKPKKTADIFAMPPMVSTPHDAWETSEEISMSRAKLWLQREMSAIFPGYVM